MNTINTLPSPNTGGTLFDFSNWTNNTVVTLANVPWDAEYRDIVEFDPDAELVKNRSIDNYIDSLPSTKAKVKGGLSHARFSAPIQLEIPFVQANKFNYLRATNAAQVGGDAQHSFYYFITHVEYLTPTVTRFYLQVDLWQSFGIDVTFGRCFVEQSHFGIAASNNFAENGRKYLTQPEGLDVGSDHVIVRRYHETISSSRYSSVNNVTYSIMVVSSIDFGKDFGTIDNPKTPIATGSSMHKVPNAASIYIFEDLGEFNKFKNYISNYPWISQGIQSIMAIPDITRYDLAGSRVSENGYEYFRPSSARAPHHTVNLLPSTWRNGLLPSRYSHLTKFLTYPYLALELTTFNGAPIILKPELMNSTTFREQANLAPPAPRVAIYPMGYNKGSGVSELTDPSGFLIDDGGEGLNVAAYLSNFPTFTILNNSGIAYLAGNAHSLAFARQSADWSQQKAFNALNTSYDQASHSIATSNQLTGIGVSAANQQTELANETSKYRAIQSGVNAGIGGLASGNIGGIASGALGAANAAVSHAINVNQANQSTAIANSSALASNRVSMNNAAYMRDTNMDLAQFAAKGDYSNAIAGINAKVQDAAIVQPTVSGANGGELFNLVTRDWGYDVRIKQIPPAILEAIGEYWLQFGYAINRFMPITRLSVMSHFTYWKMKQVYIKTGMIPETYKNGIRGIFEKGVRVWKRPDDIGSIDPAVNQGIGGVSFG